MENECDFLLPGPTKKSIHNVNDPSLQFNAIFEASSGPTTYAAEKILVKKA
jgi:glutamate dehydrogenase/leucine dehydrogenase